MIPGSIAQSWFPTNTPAKLLLLSVAILALLVLARWASGLGHSDRLEHRDDSGELPLEGGGLPHPIELPRALAPPRDHFRAFPREPNLGSVKVVKFNFAGFDADPGPPDPDEFCDELFVELYNPEHDQRWTQSYLVATPRGLAHTLEQKGWDCLFADYVFVFKRYDLQEVRRAILERIAEEQQLARAGRGEVSDSTQP